MADPVSKTIGHRILTFALLSGFATILANTASEARSSAWKHLTGD